MRESGSWDTLEEQRPDNGQDGWVASDGQESGDLCAWKGDGPVNLSTGTFAMQPTWSNSAGGCAMSG